MPWDCTASSVMDNLKTVCSGYSNLMVTMLRIVGIPARLMHGIIIRGNPIDGGNWTYSYPISTEKYEMMHVWVEYYIPGLGWLACDPTWHDPHQEQDYFELWGLKHFPFHSGETSFFAEMYDRGSEDKKYSYSLTLEAISPTAGEQSNVEDFLSSDAFAFTLTISLSVVILLAGLKWMKIKNKAPKQSNNQA
jgi:hypothetical protein